MPYLTKSLEANLQTLARRRARLMEALAIVSNNLPQSETQGGETATGKPSQDSERAQAVVMLKEAALLRMGAVLDAAIYCLQNFGHDPGVRIPFLLRHELFPAAAAKGLIEDELAWMQMALFLSDARNARGNDFINYHYERCNTAYLPLIDILARLLASHLTSPQ